MKYQHLPIAATRRRLLALTGYLKRLLSEGRFQQLEAGEQQDLLMRIRTLASRLSRVVPRRRLRQALGVLALAATATYGRAQEFAPGVLNPFGMSPVLELELAFPQLVDIDADGDFDLLSRSYGLALGFQENIGTPESPQYGPLQNDAFGVDNLGDASTITFGDLDADGDMDLLVGQYDINEPGDVEFLYFENTGTPTEPAFGPATAEPFGLGNEGVEVTIPFLADLDGDGDLDILMGTYDYGGYTVEVRFIENIGTSSAPAFAQGASSPFGLDAIPSSYAIVPVLADLDEDGDLDLILGGANYVEENEDNYRAVIDYFENVGDAQNPAFAAPVSEPFGLQMPNLTYLAIPTAADLDNDGDIDLLAATYIYIEAYEYGESNFVYFENTVINSATEPAPEELAFTLFPTVTTDELHWQLPAGTVADHLRLQVFNANGQTVREQPLQAEGGTFSVRQLPAGLYHVRLSDERGALLGVQRFVRQ